MEKTKEELLQEATALIKQDKIDRENAFNEELSVLMQKYGIQLVPHITIVAF